MHLPCPTGDRLIETATAKETVTVTETATETGIETASEISTGGSGGPHREAALPLETHVTRETTFLETLM